MTEASAGQATQLPPSQATIADLMRPPLTTIELADHAAAYRMKHAGRSALVVLNPQTGQPASIITEADIAHAVAAGKDLAAALLSGCRQPFGQRVNSLSLGD